jgi:hypothetical protein
MSIANFARIHMITTVYEQAMNQDHILIRNDLIRLTCSRARQYFLLLSEKDDELVVVLCQYYSAVLNMTVHVHTLQA